MTAKYWGRGPKTWDLPSINFKSFAQHPIPSTPIQQLEQGQSLESIPPLQSDMALDSPTQLCRWTIHYKDEEDYEGLSSPLSTADSNPEEHFDIDDESTWSEWPTQGRPQSLANTLSSGLEQNMFTMVQKEGLPLAADSIINTIKKSPDELQAEAIGFIIMSRNIDAFDEILEAEGVPECISAISPFHLAAKFLDGGKSCCLIMEELVNCLYDRNSIGLNYVDKSGHTVLDTLFATILRSHSTASLKIVSDTFADQSQCTGQEVDPCGRWDADSPCIRQLYSWKGEVTIPREWKHMFCHSSVQTVCHCISVIFTTSRKPGINTRSGLFIRRCPHCGLKLDTGPLHSLVITTFFLANHALPGETLFGMIACLVCLLTYFADPCTRVEVSISAVLGLSLADDECQHSPLNAAELASQVPSSIIDSWPHEVRQGWSVFNTILQHDVIQRRRETVSSPNALGIDFDDSTDTETEDIDSCDHRLHENHLIYCGNQWLGLVWAAIQAELLTYRRLNEDDSWLSPRFKMKDIPIAFESNDDQLINQALGVIGDDGQRMLKDHSQCGLFEAQHPGCVRREEACALYYSNLDDWKRSTFIESLEVDD